MKTSGVEWTMMFKAEWQGIRFDTEVKKEKTCEPT